MDERAVAGRLGDSNVLIGIDDTDNETSPGTGRVAQQLLGDLVGSGLAAAHGATRHQLLVDPRVPYTTHNSSACLQSNRRTSEDRSNPVAEGNSQISPAK